MGKILSTNFIPHDKAGVGFRSAMKGMQEVAGYSLRSSIIFIFCLCFLGCATTGFRGSSRAGLSLVKIKDFCEKNDLDYSYSPFYEEIYLSGRNIKVRLKPGLSYALINDLPRNIHKDVVYSRGQVFIPASLGSYLKSLKKRAAKTLPLSAKIKRIIIDPGHGGRDPGAISPGGLREKDVNLTIARYLRSFLRKKGFKVYLTRGGDYFVSLKNRVKFSRRKHPDLFISIHANANRSRRLDGLEVYYLSPKFSDTQSRILAMTEDLQQKGGLSLPLRLKSLVVDENKKNKKTTLALASSIMNSAESVGIHTKKEAIGAPFYVLKHNVCSAVLVEVGYLTNSREERLLRTSLYKKQLALAISEGVVKLRDDLKNRQIAGR